MLFHDTYPADVIDVDYCRFFPDRSQGAAVQPGNAPAFKPDHVSEHKMVIELGNPEYETIIRSIDFGSKITLLEGRRFESFTVTDLNFDKLGHLLILGTHNVSIPSGAERRRLWCTKKYVSSGRNIFVDAPLTFRELRHGNRVYENRLGRPARNDGKLSFIMRAGEYYVADVNMVVNRITVEVVTPYSGNDRIAALSVANQGLGPALPTINVNAKEKGVRGVDRTNIHGLRPGDVLSTKLAKDSYCEGLVLHLHGDGGTASFDDGPRTRLPLIVVEVDGMTL